MVLTVNKIKEDGTFVKDVASFSNDYDAEYNMLTLWLTMNNMAGQIMNKDVRDKYKDRIKRSNRSVYFEDGTDVYIATEKEKNKVTNN